MIFAENTEQTTATIPRGVRKIKGADKAYRIRVGSYRVVYEVYDKDMGHTTE